MDTERQKLGGRIKALREAKGLSQEKLAASSGLSKDYIWKTETGKAGNAGIETIAAIAKTLEVPVGYLLFGNIEAGVDLPIEQAQRAFLPGNEMLPLSHKEKKLLENWRALPPKEQNAYFDIIQMAKERNE